MKKKLLITFILINSPEFDIIEVSLKNYLNHTDEELLAMIAQDSDKAFRALFDRYWETAYKVAFPKLKSKDHTREIILDIFQNLWERRHTLDIKCFRNYLCGAIKYKVITLITKEVLQRKQITEYLNHVPVKEDATMQKIEYNDLADALAEGVKILPEKTQEVFRLNRIEGRSVSEIASELNLSEKAIEYHITQSRKGLRLYLKDFLTGVCIAIPFIL